MMAAPMQDFKIISLNVNGLNDVRKRRLVFKSLKKFKRSIILLQETHCKSGNGRLWKSQWAHTMFLTEASGSTGGIATLFSKDLDPIILEVKTSPLNRFLLVTFELNGEKYKVANLYMPTSDRESEQIEVLDSLAFSLDRDEGEYLVVGGDFNVALHQDWDRAGYSHPDIPNRRYRTHVQEFLEKFDLEDIWRIQNPNVQVFSWSRANKFARLDYIFCSDSFPGQIKADNPKIFSFSDHKLIAITFRPSITPKGKGFWKMKPSLLNRDDFCKGIKEIISQVEINSQNLNMEAKWEFLKLNIREFTIKFSKKLKEDNLLLEKELESRLFELEKDEELLSDPDLQEEFHMIKRELFQINLLQARESMIRARVNWASQGERPSKFFLNLEKKSYDSKAITEIYDNNDTLITNPEDILQFEKAHFSSQFEPIPLTDSLNQRELEESFLAPSDQPISDLDKQVLNRDISTEEMEEAVRQMKNGKSPGCDGLTVEFYKKFWGLIGKHLLASFLYSFSTGTLSPDQRRAIISLIPKKGKDKRHIQNWRPISMLNVDYKILAKVLARRLANLIPLIVHPYQTGFIPSRHIGDNIRNIQSLIDFTQGTGRSGLIVSLDFSAAFDSLRHDFLFKALQSFDLGENFLSWIQILYNSTETCVLNRGQSTGWFPFSRGIRQGCPISPFLFVLAVEKLAESIRRDGNIRGIKLLDTETKILQFADDSTIFVEDEDSLLRTLTTVGNFKELSGLGLNLNKSQGLKIGETSLSSEIARSIPWGDRCRILGINFAIGEAGETDDWTLNFLAPLEKMRKISDSWRFCNLSLKGRIVILNTLILPVIYYPCVMLPVPQGVFKKVDKLITFFLWRGKKPKISKHCLEKPTQAGGLGLHNFPNRVKSSKMSWLKRLSLPPVEPWHFFFEFKLDQPAIEIALQRSRSRKIRHTSPFFSEIFCYWREIYNSRPSSDLSVRNECLWGNSFLKGKFKKKHETVCRDLGIIKINDILSSGQLLTPTQFRVKFGTLPPAGFLERCTQNIPVDWFGLIAQQDTRIPTQALMIQNEEQEWVYFHLQSAKKIYMILESKKPKVYSCSDRWLKAYEGDEAFSPGPNWKLWHLLPYKISHEVQLQSFTYRIFYRVIPCRVYLTRLKVVSSESCLKCAERDDLFHFFFECPIVKDFWDSLATWLDGREGVRQFPDNLTEEEFMFGIINRKGDYSLINYIILCAKFYIYKVTVFKLGDPDIFQFLLELKNRLDIERQCCYADSSFNRRFKKWLVFFNDL